MMKERVCSKFKIVSDAQVEKECKETDWRLGEDTSYL